MNNKRILGAFALILGAITLLIVPAGQPAHAGVNDFVIPAFEADYYLTRDAQHNSHLQVQEHITAQFPDFDQNHGILRAIPQSYEHHSVNLQIDSITDQNGHSWPYQTTASNANLVLKIGDANRFVHGLQAYNLTYTQDYVTTKANGYDGQFWDVNGDQWSEPFAQVTARIHLTPELSAALQSSHNRCFTGAQGSTASHCTLSSTTDTTGATIVKVTTTQPLAIGETLTYELGFKSGTFAAYHLPLQQLLLWTGIIGGNVLVILIALVVVIRRWRKYGRDPKGPGIIIPEYLPPKDLSVLASNAILHEAFQPKAISAQIIDLAVRHYLKVYEIKGSGLLNRTTYELELVRTPTDLRSEEQRVLAILFGVDPARPDAVGTRVKLDNLANKLYKDAAELGKTINQQLAATGYFRTAPEKAKQPYILAGIVFLVLGLLGNFYTLGLLVVAVILFIASRAMPARTAIGVAQRNYLLGLRDYMKLAEADRLKALQSPHGELTEKIDIDDQTKLIKLYERLLPYAMLFGIEQDWIKQFAKLYQEPPEWYAGPTGAFQVGYFAASIHSLGQAATTSFAAPSSTGSGGMAGGGGGGGGGGGW